MCKFLCECMLLIPWGIYPGVIAGSYGNTVSLSGERHTVSQSGSAILRPHQPHTRAPLSPCLKTLVVHLFGSDLPVGVKWF